MRNKYLKKKEIWHADKVTRQLGGQEGKYVQRKKTYLLFCKFLLLFTNPISPNLKKKKKKKKERNEPSLHRRINFIR